MASCSELCSEIQRLPVPILESNNTKLITKQVNCHTKTKPKPKTKTKQHQKAKTTLKPKPQSNLNLNPNLNLKLKLKLKDINQTIISLAATASFLMFLLTSTAELRHFEQHSPFLCRYALAAEARNSQVTLANSGHKQWLGNLLRNYKSKIIALARRTHQTRSLSYAERIGNKFASSSSAGFAHSAIQAKLPSSRQEQLAAAQNAPFTYEDFFPPQAPLLQKQHQHVVHFPNDLTFQPQFTQTPASVQQQLQQKLDSSQQQLHLNNYKHELLLAEQTIETNPNESYNNSNNIIKLNAAAGGDTNVKGSWQQQQLPSAPSDAHTSLVAANEFQAPTTMQPPTSAKRLASATNSPLPSPSLSSSSSFSTAMLGQTKDNTKYSELSLGAKLRSPKVSKTQYLKVPSPNQIPTYLPHVKQNSTNNSHQSRAHQPQSPLSLSLMMDAFGAASQYLISLRPSSLISQVPSLAFTSIPKSSFDSLVLLSNQSSLQQQQQTNTSQNNSNLFFTNDSSLLPLASDQNNYLLPHVVEPSTSTSKTFLSRLTGSAESRSMQKREDVCGKTVQMPERRIIGGEGAKYGEFPYQVHIKIAKHQCGGALVDRQTIVTAAHCVYHFITRAPVNKLQIVIGAYDIEDENYQELPPQYFKVDKVKLHPNFRFSASHPDRYDIALLKLDKPVKYTDNVMPVCLPTKNFQFERAVGTVTGFGKTDSSLSNRYGTRLLQKVDVPIIDNNECERWHRTRGIDLKIFPEMMCAGYENGLKDACVGDSGGPLVVKNKISPDGSFRWILAGITSAGFGCAQSHQPGIYHRVSHTVDWILDNLD